MEVLAFVMGVIGVITLVVFFTISANIGKILKSIQYIQGIVKAYSEETGIGLIFKCSKCKKDYRGKPDVCPHCGDQKQYKF